MYPLVACLPHVQEYARQALLQMQQAALYQQLAAAQQLANGDAQYALLQQQQAAAAAAAAAAAGAQGNAGQLLVWVALHVESGCGQCLLASPCTELAHRNDASVMRLISGCTAAMVLAAPQIPPKLQQWHWPRLLPYLCLRVVVNL